MTRAGFGALLILSSMGAGFLRELIRIYRERHPEVAMHVLEGASAVRRHLPISSVVGNHQQRSSPGGRTQT